MTVRLFSPKRQKSQMFAWISAAVLIVLLIFYAALPRPERPPSRMDIEWEAAREMAAWLALPDASDPNAQELARARFGKALFFDRRLSSDGSQSCADCHRGGTISEQTKIEQTNQPWDPPPLVDLHLTHWFFHDGRQDSLTGAILESLEHPDALGSNRSHIAKVITQHYSDIYKNLYGDFPQALVATLPADAYPGQTASLVLPIEVASMALESVGSTETLADILATARQTYRVPANELSQRALPVVAYEKPWVDAYATLTAAEKTALTKVFANVGRAIGSYLATVRSTPSAFDKFAARLQQATQWEEALAEDFSAQALQGFAFFVGDGGCVRCHNGPRLSDQQFHNTGLDARGSRIHLGRTTGIIRLQASPYHCRAPLLKQTAEASESCKELPYLSPEIPALLGAFKTSSLRHIKNTPPYMHDGRYESLRGALEYYNELSEKAAVGQTSPLLSPLQLTKSESDALIAFLETLASSITELDGQPLPSPLVSR